MLNNLNSVVKSLLQDPGTSGAQDDVKISQKTSPCSRKHLHNSRVFSSCVVRSVFPWGLRETRVDSWTMDDALSSAETSQRLSRALPSSIFPSRAPCLKVVVSLVCLSLCLVISLHKMREQTNKQINKQKQRERESLLYESSQLQRIVSGLKRNFNYLLVIQSTSHIP